MLKSRANLHSIKVGICVLFMEGKKKRAASGALPGLVPRRAHSGFRLAPSKDHVWRLEFIVWERKSDCAGLFCNEMGLLGDSNPNLIT